MPHSVRISVRTKCDTDGPASPPRPPADGVPTDVAGPHQRGRRTGRTTDQAAPTRGCVRHAHGMCYGRASQGTRTVCACDATCVHPRRLLPRFGWRWRTPPNTESGRELSATAGVRRRRIRPRRGRRWDPQPRAPKRRGAGKLEVQVQCPAPVRLPPRVRRPGQSLRVPAPSAHSCSHSHAHPPVLLWRPRTPSPRQRRRPPFDSARTLVAARTRTTNAEAGAARTPRTGLTGAPGGRRSLCTT